MKTFAVAALGILFAACAPNQDPNDTGGSVASTGVASTGTTATASTGSTTGATTAGAATTAAASTGGTTGHATTSGTTGATTTATTGTGTTSGSTSSGTTTGACEANEFATCSSDSACTCGLTCVKDSAFVNSFFGTTESVCERPCHTAADCTNAASSCTIAPPIYVAPDAGLDAGPDAEPDAGADAGDDDAGPDAGQDAGEDAGIDAGQDAGIDGGLDAGEDAGSDAGPDAGPDAGIDAGPAGSCAVSQCLNSQAGAACPVSIVDPDAGAVATALGTCIPQGDVMDANDNIVLLCLPPGSATSCDAASDDNPLLSGGGGLFGSASLKVATPQSYDPSTLCAAGEGCNDGGCAVLCIPGETVCDGGGSLTCVTGDANDTSWGFCSPCVSSGSDGGTAGVCATDSDCCEDNCDGEGSGFSNTMTCSPAGQ